jgi:hypothetical protein
MAHRRYTILLGLLLSGLLVACSPAPESRLNYDPATLRFSGERAFALQSNFVQRFPNRHSGRPNNRLAAKWLQVELTRLGWACRLDQWEIVNYSRLVPLRNVVCELAGQSPQQILVVAHHDQSPNTVEGADNDGSGIAILLHLAEIFAAEPNLPYTLVFVATDAEEYGMIGTGRYVETHPDPSQIIAAISLDNLGKDFYNGIEMSPVGQFRGYGPIWLLLTAREAAQAAGNLWVPDLRTVLAQIVDQAVPVSFMDQGPLVAAGVSAFGFTGTYPAEAAELHWQTYHTPQDTMIFQSPATLFQTGRVSEAVLRQLLAMTEFPDESGPYLYFDDSRRTWRGLPLWIGFIAIVGLFLGGSYLSGGKLDGAKLRAWRDALPHFLGLWLPLLASIGLLYLFVAVGLMDTYHRYPAAAKDPALYQPRWPAVFLYLAGLTFFLVVGHKSAGHFGNQQADPAPGQLKSLALLIVGLAGLYLLVINPFSLLFLVPLVAWFFIGGRRGAGRLVDILLFALGGLIVYVLFYFFGFVILRIDWAILWYLMMMFSIGMIGFPTTITITAILAAGLMLVITPPNRGLTEAA